MRCGSSRGTRMAAVLLAVFLAAWRCTLSEAAPAAKPSGPQLFAASDGAGGIRLLWYVPLEQWRSEGWRVFDDKDRELARLSTGGDEEALSLLQVEERKRIRRLAANLDRIPREERAAVGVLAGLRAMGDWDYARALGVAIELTGLRKGEQTIVVRGGDVRLSTRIDPYVATPLPPVPGLRAESDAHGIRLYWNPVRGSVPVLRYELERVQPALRRTLLLGTEWKAEDPRFTDALPGGEYRYEVAAVDALGRRGVSAEIRVESVDMNAVVPPAELTGDGGKGRVVLTWAPNAAGSRVRVERAMLHGGPYEIVVPQPVAAGVAKFEDPHVRTGTLYYYRLRSVDGKGNAGEATPPVGVLVTGGSPPDAPAGLSADLGSTRVRLTWKAPETPISGFTVERRQEGGDWMRLNDGLFSEPRYDDHLGTQATGRYEYRVFAVGPDGTVSRAGGPVQVVLRDQHPPAPPRIERASGADGKATLGFAAAEPRKDTRQILVLRGGEPEEIGLVLGDPLPGDATRFEDRWVEPGARYYYRLVAVDAAGNRSEPGMPVGITVTAAPIPEPPGPRARFEQAPFPRVVLEFVEPPAGLFAVVEVRNTDGRWQIVSGPQRGTTASDANPASGTSRYRIVYQAPGGAQGPPSTEVEVKGEGP